MPIRSEIEIYNGMKAEFLRNVMNTKGEHVINFEKSAHKCMLQTIASEIYRGQK